MRCMALSSYFDAISSAAKITVSQTLALDCRLSAAQLPKNRLRHYFCVGSILYAGPVI